MKTLLNRSSLFLSLQTKLIVGFSLIFTVIFALTYYQFYTIVNNYIMVEIKKELYYTILGATELDSIDGVLFTKNKNIINGDRMEKLIKDGVKNTSESTDNPHTDDSLYWEELHALCQIIRLEPRAKPYTYIPSKKPNKLIFITSYGWCLEGATTESYATFKQTIEFKRVDANLAGMEQIVFQTKDGWCTYQDTDCIPAIYTDSYGTWVSAFAPIKNSAGKTVAALGVDFEAKIIAAVQKNILDSIYLVFGASYIFLLILVYLTAQTLTRPLSRLTMTAKQIGKGYYDLEPDPFTPAKFLDNYPDEITLLSTTMGKMSVDLKMQRDELINNREKMSKLARTTIQSQEAERRYYSRELHDNAGQILTDLKHKIVALFGGMQTNQKIDKQFQARLTHIINETDKTLGMIRDISHKMRPASLDVGDINIAFETQCFEFSKNNSIKVNYTGSDGIDTSDEIAVSLYRFLQEALTNISKHANGVTSVQVNLIEKNETISMSVVNNGNSITQRVGSKGIGLIGMKERFSLLGGVMHTEMSPAGGFLVSVTVPNKLP